MSESDNFKKYIDDFFEDLKLYDDYNNGHHYEDLLKASIDVFLKKETPYSALDIYRIFFMIYQITSENKSHPNKSEDNLINEPNTLLDLVKIMKRYEDNAGDLIDKQRDHFIHSVNVFLLGLAIYSQNENYRNYFIDYIKSTPYEKYYKIDKEYSHEEFLYRWGVAALFHDIGYPVEIIGNQLKKFINDGIQPISSEYSVNLGIDFTDLDKFNHILIFDEEFPNKYLELYPDAESLDLYKPTDIMAHKISREFKGLPFDKLYPYLNNYVNNLKKKGFIDHGFFSSVLVLDSYGYLIQKYGKDSFFFYFPIVDSASAILLHNFYPNTLKRPITSEDLESLDDQKDSKDKKEFKCPKFELVAMEPSENPLAYLLILCDELQEWNRQPIGVKTKQKSHVNELKICIDNKHINVDYIIKHGSMGIDFSSKKEKDLRKVLNINAVFENDLKVRTCTVKSDEKIEENALRNILKQDIQAPEVLARNVEKLAREIHNQYNILVESQYLDLLRDNPAYLNLIDNKSELDYFLEKHPEFNKEDVKKNINDYQGSDSSLSDRSELDIFLEKYPEFKEYCNEDNYNREDFLKENPKFETIKVLVDYSVGMPEEFNKEKEELYKALEKKKKFDDIVPFEDLPAQLKMSNIRQARSIPKKLAMVGCELAHLDDEREAVLEFSNDELIDLAILEHDDWCEEREGTGWTYGPTKDTEELISPYLVPWTELDEDIREYDKEPVRKIPGYAKAIGLKVVPSRIKMLTVEMHNFYEESSFDSLPNYIKYSNYKYTNYLVKLLFREGYSLVEIKEKGSAIKSLDSDLIEDILKTEHNAWVRMREQLGWSYGKEKDDVNLTNPNLVDWDVLDEGVKENNRKTFRALPDLCKKVGLKIVKI